MPHGINYNPLKSFNMFSQPPKALFKKHEYKYGGTKKRKSQNTPLTQSNGSRRRGPTQMQSADFSHVHKWNSKCRRALTLIRNRGTSGGERSVQEAAQRPSTYNKGDSKSWEGKQSDRGGNI